MKRVGIIAIVLAILGALPGISAAEIPGFALWSAERLGSAGSALHGRVSNHLAFEQIGDFGGHLALIVYRDASGEAEYHEKQSDFYVIREGEATLVVGGTMVDPRETGPGELRGPSIRDGETFALRPGDVVNIPPAVPHQILLSEGKTFTYFILKVTTPKE